MLQPQRVDKPIDTLADWKKGRDILSKWIADSTVVRQVFILEKSKKPLGKFDVFQAVFHVFEQIKLIMIVSLLSFFACVRPTFSTV